MTQLEKASAGITTPEMKAVDEKEQVNVQWLRDKIAEGRIVIPANMRQERLRPSGGWAGVRGKDNANLGTS